MSLSIISRIKNYIDIYATIDVKNRGENLFSDKQIKKAEINNKNGSAVLEVQGTNLYLVSINGLNDYLKTQCTCPYDWGPVCKHQIAALLFLIEFFGGQPLTQKPNVVTAKPIYTPKLPRPNLRLSSIPYQIEDYRNITLEVINKHTTHFTGSNFWGKYETILFEKKRLHFKVIDSAYNSSSPYLVKFYHAEKGFFTECSCNQKVFALCTHQIFILTKIAKSANPDIFNLLLPDNLKAIKNEILEKYGLKKHKFDTFFMLTYKGLVIDYDLLTEYKYLIPVTGKTELESGIESNIKNLESDIVKLEMPFIKTGENEKKHPGFVFKIFSSPTLPFKNELELNVIGGRENKAKDKLVSGFVDYHQNRNDHIVLTNQQQELLEKIVYFEQSEKTQNPKTDLINKQIGYFKFLKKVFPILSQEKYVYVDSGEGIARNSKKSDLFRISISSEHPELEFDVSDNSIFIELSPSLIVKGEKYSYDKIDTNNSHYLFSCINDTLYLHKSISQSILINQFAQGKLAIVKTETNTFFEKFIKPISNHCRINFLTDLFTIKEVPLKSGIKEVYLSEIGNYVVFKPIILYHNEIRVAPGSTGDMVIRDDQNSIIRYLKDTEYEDAFLDFMSQLHPEFETQRYTGFFNLESDRLLENFWFFDAFSKMEESGIEVYGLKDLKSFRYSPHRAKVNTGIKSGQDWFEVEVEVAYGDTIIDLKSIKKAVLNQEKYIRLSDGTIGILPEEWINQLGMYFRTGEIAENKLKISKLKFTIIEELFNNIKEADILKELAEKRKKLSEIEIIRDVRKPKEINAKLRDYQKAGIKWLNLLNEMGWGGILADDMGLGKTLQILTLIQMQVNKNKKTNLIVVPTTLLFNWEMELKKFAPLLTFHFYYGINREKEIESFKKYHIVFTTYGVMTRDIEFLRTFKFNYIVLDESQAIKNPLSLRYKAAFLLQAENKLTLTGTPIENSTFDLYAQMNFVNPGFLGTVDSFKEQYAIVIDKENNAEISAELNRMIHPFILRRTKEQVAKELPPKTETILFCEMREEQRAVYDAFRNKYRDKLLNKFVTEGFEKSKMYVLEGLMKLRQICDSPAILSDDENYGEQSVKIEELKRHILEKTSNHKILVFSQFVRMLKLIRIELIGSKIEFEYLDGQSSKKQREESVNRFQELTECRVFLISLKAGGMGLNLTAADYVYLIDPWWNPAVENQAIDRTHRIGQKKSVFAYRMICKNTVEEKIINLQAKKTKIAKDIITSDESIIKKLTEKDINELFS